MLRKGFFTFWSRGKNCEALESEKDKEVKKNKSILESLTQ